MPVPCESAHVRPSAPHCASRAHCPLRRDRELVAICSTSGHRPRGRAGLLASPCRSDRPSRGPDRRRLWTYAIVLRRAQPLGGLAPHRLPPAPFGSRPPAGGGPGPGSWPPGSRAAPPRGSTTRSAFHPPSSAGTTGLRRCRFFRNRCDRIEPWLRRRLGAIAPSRDLLVRLGTRTSRDSGRDSGPPPSAGRPRLVAMPARFGAVRRASWHVVGGDSRVPFGFSWLPPRLPSSANFFRSRSCARNAIPPPP